MKLIDLSISIEDELPVDPELQIGHIQYAAHDSELALSSMLGFFPGLTQEELKDGQAWAIESVSMTTHTGTHMDAPYHYHPTMNNGERAWTIDEMPLEWGMGDGVVFDFRDKSDGYVCTVQDMEEYLAKIHYQLKPGNIVLVNTGAMTKWGSAEYMMKGCGIGREATLWLAAQGIHVVGTDAWSWDAPLAYEAKKYAETHDSSLIWEGHKAGAECIYFQMEKVANLDKLPPFGFKVMAFPIKVDKASAGWVRPVAILD